MKHLGWVVVALHVILTAAYAVIPINMSKETSPVSVAELNRDVSGMFLRVELATPTWETVQTEHGEVVRAIFTSNETLSAGMTSEPGTPVVPVVSRFFRLPATGGITVAVSSVEYEIITDVDYALYVDEDIMPPFGKNESAVDAWYPESIVEITEPAIMRDFRVAMLVSHPVQVNPARREVRIYSSYDVRLTYNNEDHRNELDHWPTKLSVNYIDYYREFLDWRENELNEYELYRGGMQVVIRTSAIPELQDWIDWKRQKGWDVHLLTEDDVSTWTASSIKTELAARFSASDPKFDFVVIVGDANGEYAVPPAGVIGDGYGDHPYSLLNGSDEIADVALGRISAEISSELSTYEFKVLHYEKEPYIGDMGWYLRGMVAAGSSSSGISTVMVGRYARHLMLGLGYTQVDTAWYLQHTSDEVNRLSSQAINAGVSFYTYRGFLNTGLGVVGIQALENSFRLPFVIDVTCGTGNWYGDTGFNEAWMRAGTPTNPKGAIGAISTATSDTHTRPNNALTGGGIKSLLVLRNPHMGMAWYGMMMNLYQNLYPYEEVEVQKFSLWANLMGDPTVWLWTDAPHNLTVVAPATFQLGMNSFDVTVTESGQPIEDAWVTLYKSDDNEEMIAKGISDAGGHVTLNTPIQYTGDAVLTVTKQNCKPYTHDVDVISADRIGLVDAIIVDDGSDGTSGNSNGIPEAGETVGVRLTAKNFGTSSYSNVEATLAEDEESIHSVTGTASFGTLAVNSEATSNNVILIEIAPNAKHNWISHFDLTFSSNALEWNDHYQLTLQAPQFAIVQQNVTGILDPGDSATLNFVLTNVGNSSADEGTAQLLSLDSHLGIDNVFVDMASAAPGQNVDVGPFNISSHPASFSGYPADFKLIIATSSGQTDTLYGTLDLGDRDASDPMGPDRYGYFAYDNTDTAYDSAPSYNWVEINPTAAESEYNGTHLDDINDNGAEDDDAQVVDLPFDIQYYGDTFSQMTVFSNGYVAMGVQPDLAIARNWTIPSPLGPDYMIAPYWDDRIISNGGGIYVYYDEPNGRYIVEWYQLHDINNTNPCTFQAIFYDQNYGHATLTGDTEILFQYHTVSHTVGDVGVDVPYFTTGIENGDQTDGLLCSYWNMPQSGMAPISNECAILFSTEVVLITGTISGTVTRELDSSPVEGVSVHTDDWKYYGETDENGNYVLHEVNTGFHNLVVTGSCVNTVILNDVEVEEEENTDADFEVTFPEFAINLEEIVETLNSNAERVIPMTLTNDGDGPTEFEVTFDFWGSERSLNDETDTDELDEVWELLYQHDLDEVEMRNRGIIHDGRFYWVSGSNNVDNEGPNKLYQYSNRGELLQIFNQPVTEPNAVGFYSMAWDGTYLYGAEDHVLYQMQYVNDEIRLVDSWDIPSNPATILAYDSINDLFWMGDRNTPLYGVDRDGDTQYEYDFSFTISAIGFYEQEPQGYNLIAMSDDQDSDRVSLYRIDPSTGSPYLTSTLMTDGYQALDIVITNRWNPLFWTINALFDGTGSSQDHVKIWELTDNTEWIELGTETGIIPAGGQMTVDVTIRSLDLPNGEYSIWLRFDHHTCDEVTILPVNMSVEVSVAEGDSEQPLEWAFYGAYPNPFNPTTTVRFSLQEATNVHTRLFNVMGQQVAEIHNGVMTAGRHQEVVDGRGLASGVYFLTLEAGPLNITRKLVLLK